MNRRLIKVVSLLLMVSLLAISSLVACSEEEEEGDKTTIDLAMLIPLSGPAASAYQPMIACWEAFCDYINTEDPIPGIELDVIEYDTQYSPAEAIPGYQWLQDQGAKFITWTDTQAAETLKDRADEDHYIIFAGGCTDVITANPGYIFAFQPAYSQQTETFMKWLEDSWPDYPTKPKVGCFGWNITYGIDHNKGAKEYAEANPDKFEWVGTYLAPYGTSTWSSEVESLKDCDYVICGAFAGGAAGFINEFRAKGYTGRTVHTDSNMGFWDVYLAACGEEYLNGAIWLNNTGYPKTDTYPTIELLNDIVDSAGTAVQDAIDTLPQVVTACFLQFNYLVEMLREAVDQVENPDDIDGDLLYDIITTMDFELTGYPSLGYTSTLRVSQLAGKVFEYSELAGDFHEVHSWIIPPSYEDYFD